MPAKVTLFLFRAKPQPSFCNMARSLSFHVGSRLIHSRNVSRPHNSFETKAARAIWQPKQSSCCCSVCSST